MDWKPISGCRFGHSDLTRWCELDIPDFGNDEGAEIGDMDGEPTGDCRGGDDYSGGTILTSRDGVSWTSQISGTTYQLNSVTWTGTKLVAVGELGTILTSSDGVTWISQISGTTDLLYAVRWVGSQLVVMGENGTILTSPDGVTWTSQHSGSKNALYSITWTGIQLVAVGVFESSSTDAALFASSDGIVWTKSRISGSLSSVTWTGSQLVAVGDKILASPDGKTWTIRIPETKHYMNSVTWTGTKLVAVGHFGDILTSP